MTEKMRLAEPEELKYEPAAVIIDRVPSPNYNGNPQLYFTMGETMLSVTHRGEWTWFRTVTDAEGRRTLGAVKPGGPDERYARQRFGNQWREVLERAIQMLTR